jgi:hypothetical protein
MITYSFIGSLSSKGPTFSKNSYMLTWRTCRLRQLVCIFFHAMLALYVSNVSYFLGVNVAIAPQWQHQKNVFVVLKCPQLKYDYILIYWLVVVKGTNIFQELVHADVKNMSVKAVGNKINNYIFNIQIIVNIGRYKMFRIILCKIF